jgi:hypothetical protein
VYKHLDLCYNYNFCSCKNIKQENVCFPSLKHWVSFLISFCAKWVITLARSKNCSWHRVCSVISVVNIFLSYMVSIEMTPWFLLSFQSWFKLLANVSGIAEVMHRIIRSWVLERTTLIYLAKSRSVREKSIAWPDIKAHLWHSVSSSTRRLSKSLDFGCWIQNILNRGFLGVY